MDLKCLKKGAGEEAVVFVHGLLSSGAKCWLHSNQTYWPDLVVASKALGDPGTYVFTYQSDVFSGGYHLDDAVDALKENLRLDGVLDHRRIVFVCHSMGGILVRRYLVRWQLEILERGTAHGLFLVASPSLGSDYANWLSPIAQFFGHSQAQALRFADENTWLNSLDRDFQNLKEDRRLPLHGKELVEDKFVLLSKLGLFKQVVRPFTGARYFGEPFKVPGSDHFSIAKPAGPDDIQHKLLCAFIADPRLRAAPKKEEHAGAAAARVEVPAPARVDSRAGDLMREDEIYDLLLKLSPSHLTALTVKLRLNPAHLPGDGQPVAIRADAILNLVKLPGAAGLPGLEKSLKEVIGPRPS